MPFELYSLLSGLVSDFVPDPRETEPKRYREGGERTYIQTAKERDPDLREDAIKAYGRVCKVCDFDFDAFYGPDLSIGYVEVHHIKPLSTLSSETDSRIEDVIVICSNCHRIIHRRKGDTLDWKELRREVRKRRK